MSLALRLYTDFVCPYCFVAEASTVPRLLRDYELTLDWRGFELHPGTPRGGVPLSMLFPGVPLRALHEQVQRFGARFGVTNFTPPDTLRNSRRALAIAELARERDVLEPFRRAAFDAHFRHGKNIEADGDLRELASLAGLDPDAALAAADDPVYLGRVDAKQAQARAEGVTGIPTFFVGKTRVVGCQPYEVLAQAVESAGAERRSD